MNFERPASSSTNTVRETVMRQSYVVSSAMPVQQRSFISTSLVNDSFAFGDDLRKFILFYSDLESKTCLAIRKPISDKIFNLSLFFRLSKLKDSLTKLKFFELD